MKVGNVGTSVRDDNECKRTMMERKKCYGRCVGGEAWLPVKWLKIKLWLGGACES